MPDQRKPWRKSKADPKAFDRLGAGEAELYGKLRGEKGFFGPDRERQSAHREVVGLRAALYTYREAQGGLDRQREATSKLGGRGADEIRSHLSHVSAALRHATSLVRSPERALENAVRQLGRAAVSHSISLLPSPLKLPARVLLNVAEKALDLGRDLGR